MAICSAFHFTLPLLLFEKVQKILNPDHSYYFFSSFPSSVQMGKAVVKVKEAGERNKQTLYQGFILSYIANHNLVLFFKNIKLPCRKLQERYTRVI